MPELPEVRTAVKYIAKDVVGQKIVDLDFLVPKMVKGSTVKTTIKKIMNKKIHSVDNFGKFIIFNLSDNLVLLSHLRMEGKYRFSKLLELTKHDHAWFKFKTGYLIYNDVRKFGTFELKNKKDLFNTNPLKKLANIPSKTNADQLYKKLQKKSIAIKSVLLDQTLILGLGNIYVDEVLFAAKILPSRKASSISKKEVASIIKTATKIMDAATNKGGSSIRTYKAYANIVGTYQKHLKVHTRENKKCLKCQTPIKKIKINGRGTYYCLHCQK